MEKGQGHASASDGTPIALQVAGHGPAVVLVHSAAADARQWARLVPLLAERFTVVTMDRRGRGRSGPIGPGHSLEVEYGDVAAVVASIGGLVHLVGHSSGARYALHAALRIPNLASLTLYEPPEPEKVTDLIVESLANLEAVQDREAILWAFFGDVLGVSHEEFSELKSRPIWPLMYDNALTLPAELRAARSYRLDPQMFAALAVPAMLLVGELSDPEDLRTTNALHTILPNSHVVTLAGQGHGAMFSAPLLLASVLTGFFDSVDGD
ncbi:MAG: alpha/beta hydrolase, partial [Actinomycetota bacterium]|nr:alpha/beta hydrolase [Actinomycetota bacterium]